MKEEAREKEEGQRGEKGRGGRSGKYVRENGNHDDFLRPFYISLQIEINFHPHWSSLWGVLTDIFMTEVLI